jgi:hypothetical protein
MSEELKNRRGSRNWNQPPLQSFYRRAQAIVLSKKHAKELFVPRRLRDIKWEDQLSPENAAIATKIIRGEQIPIDKTTPSEESTQGRMNKSADDESRRSAEPTGDESPKRQIQEEGSEHQPKRPRGGRSRTASDESSVGSVASGRRGRGRSHQ